MCGHRGDDPGAAVHLGQARERGRHPLERHPEREDAASVDRGRDPVARQLGERRDLVEQQLLHRVRRQPVALDRPLARAADGEETRVLPRAVVREKARAAPLLGAELEVGLRRRRVGEQVARRLELLGLRAMRRAGDRDLDSETSARSRASGSAWIGFDEER